MSGFPTGWWISQLPGSRPVRHGRQHGAHSPGYRPDAPTAKPILEINPNHEIVKQIDVDSENAGEWAKLLFDQAALAEGATLKNPGEFVKRMNQLLVG